MDAARSLFGTRGYDGTSIRDIATHAGTTVGAFYKHFHSKRQLLVMLMREVVERFGTIDLRPPARGMMQVALRGHFRELFSYDAGSYYVVRAWLEAAAGDAELAGLHEEMVAWTHQNVERLFTHLAAEPTARSESDVETFARIMNHYMWTLLGRAAALPQEEFDRQMLTIADVVYRYLFRDRR